MMVNIFQSSSPVVPGYVREYLLGMCENGLESNSFAKEASNLASLAVKI